MITSFSEGFYRESVRWLCMMTSFSEGFYRNLDDGSV